MAAIDVQLIRQESGISNGRLTAQRVYHVVVEPGDDSETARLAPGIPSPGSFFKVGSSATVQSVRARNLDEDQLTYEVVVDYAEPDTELPDDDTTTQNPLETPPQYNWGGSVISEPFFRDASDPPEDWTEADGEWTGYPVVNSAGEDFQQLPERQLTVGMLTITRNEATYNDWIAETYKNTVNANSITIGDTTYPPGTLLMQNITASGPHTTTLPNEESPEQPINVTYYQISYEIAKSVDGFDLKLEDRGLNEISVETVTENGNTYTITKLKPILGIDNQPVQTPYPLDGQGRAMPNATDPPAILVFKKYKSKDWSPLNLGESEED